MPSASWREKFPTRRFRTAFWVSVAALLLGSTVLLTVYSQSAGPFTPPALDVRRAAIGPITGLSPELRRALVPSEAFAPIPRPGPSDWLAQHAESGQTFEQYLASRPNRPVGKRKTIYFLPLGRFPDRVAPDLDRLRQFASAFFALPIKIQDPVPLEGLPIEARRRSSGDQLLSTDVLSWLKTRVPRDAYCLLAITMKDLYPDPEWNFVFGQASLRDRVGVYSFARYDPAFYGHPTGADNRALVLLRSCKVLAHETGHMFGIKHCVHFHCLMNGSNHLAESDAQPVHLCPVCLRKLHWASKFDVRRRYAAMRQFCDNVGWSDESDWLRRRLDSLE